MVQLLQDAASGAVWLSIQARNLRECTIQARSLRRLHRRLVTLHVRLKTLHLQPYTSVPQGQPGARPPASYPRSSHPGPRYSLGLVTLHVCGYPSSLVTFHIYGYPPRLVTLHVRRPSLGSTPRHPIPPAAILAHATRQARQGRGLQHSYVGRRCARAGGGRGGGPGGWAAGGGCGDGDWGRAV